jgi:WD40 repeat protein
MDEKQRSMAVGNIDGKIVLLNAINGAKLLSLPGHNGEVTHIVSSTQNDKNVFITAGTDNIINIVKESDQSGYELLRTLSIRKDTNITSMIFCDSNRYIIIGTAMGAIGFYESDTGKLISTLSDQSLDEITSVNRMDVDMLVVTNSLGSISVLTMPPRVTKFEKLLSVSHIDPEKPGSTCQLGIVTSTYSDSLRKLFVADDKMFLTCYNFDSLHSNIFEAINAEQNNKMIGGRRNAQYMNFKLDIVWRSRTHTEQLKFLEYICS